MLKNIRSIKLLRDVEKLNVWRNNFKGIRWTDKKGNLLRGAVDDILQHKDGDTAYNYKFQLEVYNYLLRKNGYKTADYGYLLFYIPDKAIENVVEFKTRAVKMKLDTAEAGRVFAGAIKLLNGNKPEETCEYCKHTG